MQGGSAGHQGAEPADWQAPNLLGGFAAGSGHGLAGMSTAAPAAAAAAAPAEHSPAKHTRRAEALDALASAQAGSEESPYKHAPLVRGLIKDVHQHAKYFELTVTDPVLQARGQRDVYKHAFLGMCMMGGAFAAHEKEPSVSASHASLREPAAAVEAATPLVMNAAKAGLAKAMQTYTVGSNSDAEACRGLHRQLAASMPGAPTLETWWRKTVPHHCQRCKHASHTAAWTCGASKDVNGNDLLFARPGAKGRKRPYSGDISEQDYDQSASVWSSYA